MNFFILKQAMPRIGYFLESGLSPWQEKNISPICRSENNKSLPEVPTVSLVQLSVPVRCKRMKNANPKLGWFGSVQVKPSPGDTPTAQLSLSIHLRPLRERRTCPGHILDKIYAFQSPLLSLFCGSLPKA